jgi:hypothetical protein
MKEILIKLWNWTGKMMNLFSGVGAVRGGDLIGSNTRHFALSMGIWSFLRALKV